MGKPCVRWVPRLYSMTGHFSGPARFWLHTGYTHLLLAVALRRTHRHRREVHAIVESNTPNLPHGLRQGHGSETGLMIRSHDGIEKRLMCSGRHTQQSARRMSKIEKAMKGVGRKQHQFPRRGTDPVFLSVFQAKEVDLTGEYIKALR